MSYSLALLIEQAKSISQKAYAPYSKYAVGCAIESINGQIFTGCNIENISFGLTICAERVAICKAVSVEGPTFKVKRVVIFTPTHEPTTPCGACRQVLKEFGANFEIISVCNTDKRISGDIDFFLPDAPDIQL